MCVPNNPGFLEDQGRSCVAQAPVKIAQFESHLAEYQKIRGTCPGKAAVSTPLSRCLSGETKGKADHNPPAAFLKLNWGTVIRTVQALLPFCWANRLAVKMERKPD